MHNPTILATGQIAPHATIEVHFVAANGKPDAVRVIWPREPTQVSPAHLADIASAACRVLANASVELSRLKAGRKR
jgi:hypothetical protein